VTYGTGLFVAVGRNAPGAHGVMTSEDGVEWTMRTGAMDKSWANVTYGGGQCVAVSSSGGLKPIMTSPDRLEWTSRPIPGGEATITWADIVYGNGRFVAVASSAYTLARTTTTSEDGITWTMNPATAQISWYGVTYGNGVFVAVARSGMTGVDRVMTSEDGMTWTPRAAAVNNEWRSVTFGDGLFVAVSTTGVGNRVMTSEDGITWTSRISAADNNWNGVTYGNGTFVAVGSSGNGNRVMTSGTILPADEPTVTTAAASEVMATSATLGGEVTDDGGGTVRARGIVYNSSGTPTVEDDKMVAMGTNIGVFSRSVSGFVPGTTYHVRAYATNGRGTSHG